MHFSYDVKRDIKGRLGKDFTASLYQGEGRQTCPPPVQTSLLARGRRDPGETGEAVGHSIPYSPASDEGPSHGEDRGA